MCVSQNNPIKQKIFRPGLHLPGCPTHLSHHILWLYANAWKYYRNDFSALTMLVGQHEEHLAVNKKPSCC